jgi:hypothetical protein
MARGDFFAIDRRSWALVCSLGMNPTVVYLVLARGSGRDNCSTSWSANAVAEHTGVSWTRAKEAILGLEKARLVDVTNGGSRPRYRLRPWGEIDLNASNDPAEMIWLPNTLVTGAANESPPVELLRQTRDVLQLRLFVDLYHAQNLADDGGISRRTIYKRFERRSLGERGEHVVFAFWEDKKFCEHVAITSVHCRNCSAPRPKKQCGSGWAEDFFARFSCLERLGLVEWNAHLFEGDDEDAEAIHPLGSCGGHPSAALELEQRLGLAAEDAANALLPNWTVDQEILNSDNPPEWLVPVQAHRAKASVVGIARLRYRPHTAMTAAWRAKLEENGAQWIAYYEEIEREQRVA